MFRSVGCNQITESLSISTDVFEPRTSTGSLCSSFSTFSCLTNDLSSSHFSIYDLIFSTKSELYRSKRRSFDFRLTSVAQKRLCLSSLTFPATRNAAWIKLWIDVTDMVCRSRVQPFFSARVDLTYSSLKYSLLRCVRQVGCLWHPYKRGYKGTRAFVPAWQQN